MRATCQCIRCQPSKHSPCQFPQVLHHSHPSRGRMVRRRKRSENSERQTVHRRAAWHDEKVTPLLSQVVGNRLCMEDKRVSGQCTQDALYSNASTRWSGCCNRHHCINPCSLYSLKYDLHGGKLDRASRHSIQTSSRGDRPDASQDSCQFTVLLAAVHVHTFVHCP